MFDLFLLLIAAAVDPPAAPKVATIGTLERKLASEAHAVRLLSGGKRATIVTHAGESSVWNLETGRRESAEQIPGPGVAWAWCTSCCTDGRWVYGWFDDNGLVRYDTHAKRFTRLAADGPRMEAREYNERLLRDDLPTPASVTVSADGRTLALKREAYRPADRVREIRLTVWDSDDGRVRVRCSTTLPPGEGIVLAADGKWLAYVGHAVLRSRFGDRKDEWSVLLVDAASGAVARRFGDPVDEAVALDGFSPDGRQLLTHSPSGGTTLWDVATGWAVRHWKPPLGGGPSAFTADGRRVLVGTARWDVGRLTLCDRATGDSVREYVTSDFSPGHVVLTPDGRTLLTVNRDQCVRVWDAATGAERFPVPGHVGPISHAAWLPDESGLVTGGWDGAVRVWHVGRQAEQALLPAPHLTDQSRCVSELAVGPGGRWVAVGQSEVGVRVWDRVTNRVVRADVRSLFGTGGGQDDYVREVAFASPSELRVADGAARVRHVSLDAEPRGPVAEMPGQFGGHRKEQSSGAHDLRGGLGAWSYSRVVATAGGQRTARDEMRVWDYRRNELRAVHRLPEDSDLKVLAVDPTGRFAVTDAAGGQHRPTELTVHDLASWKRVALLYLPYGTPAGPETYFSADGRLFGVVTGRFPNRYTVFDTATFSRVATVAGGGFNGSLVFSPTGRRVAVAGDAMQVFVHDLRAAVDPAPPPSLTATEAASCWDDLGSSRGRTALRAAYRLADHPTAAVAVFRARLKPAAKPPAAEVAGWVQALDAPAFADRQAAARRLSGAADVIDAELHEQVRRNPSPEAVQAVEIILAAAARARPRSDPGSLRACRVVHVLEMIGPPGAALLREYAGGVKGAVLTAEAQRAVGRAGR